MTLIPSDKIYTAPSLIVPGERGVFAKIAIKKGEIIEVCPVIPISQYDTAEIHEASLVTYMFYYGKCAFITLGFGSLYNHSNTPNALYTIDSKDKIITFHAITDIAKDREITIMYAKESGKPLWFATLDKKA